MDKELLKEILSVVRADKNKHNVDHEGQPVLSEVIYELKYGAKKSDDKQLKSKERESELAQAEEKSAKDQVGNKEEVSKKKPRNSKSSKAEIREELKQEQVNVILGNISNLSESDINSPELMFELERLMIYKDEDALRKTLQSNMKYKSVISNKLNIAAFNLVNNSSVNQEVSR